MSTHSGIAGWGRGAIFFGGRSQEFCEDRLQGVRPDLVTGQRWMKVVFLHDALKQLAITMCELAVDVQITNLVSCGHLREPEIDRIG